MATTNILAAGTTAGNATDVVVTTAAKAVTLFPASGIFLPSGVICRVLKLNSSAGYTATPYVLSSSANSVTGMQQSQLLLTAPGTYRVQRPDLSAVTSIGVGVDQDDAT